VSEGVEKFSNAIDTLLAAIGKTRERLASSSRATDAPQET
jgi:hypothetical protein